MSEDVGVAADQVQSEQPIWEDVLRILGIQKHAHEIQSCDVHGKALPTITDWAFFYTTYSQYKGFSVRNDKIRRDKDNILWQRRWVCSREGFREKKWTDLEGRKRAPKPVTRIGCKASLTVSFVRECDKWVATGFVAEHNHELASPSELHFLRSHRFVPDSMVAQATSLKNAGIRTISILDYIAMQCGGRECLPFLKKDFYNKLAKERRAVGNETDSEGALGYLTCLAIRDGNFFCRFNVDEEDRLHTIFWSDGVSRNDYKVFGDVLAFDTTYRTNAYNKPLMIIVGVNHHYRTTVYGVALLSDETISTYTWVLQQFLDCMGGQHPKTVVTDGDLAMRGAIIDVFPDAIHRLCAWHLSTNAASNVPNGEFKIQFAKLMYKFYTEEEFEEQWKETIENHNLQENLWAKNTYDKKANWAETFLRGNYFGGMRTTQRCESMNSYMRRFLDSKHLLRDFVSQIDQGIQHIRYTEIEDDFKTKHTEPLIPSSDPLKVYYTHFASVCTRNIYNIIAKEIEKHNSYTVSSSDFTTELRVFRLSRFCFGEIRHAVRFYPDNNHFSCGCLLLETDGIPCRHIFTVMKHLSFDRVPQSLIRPCWQKDAKASQQLQTSISPIRPEVLQSGRFGTLASDFNTLGMYASKYEDTFLEARKQFASLTETFKNICTVRGAPQQPQTREFNEGIAITNNVIRDPIPAKTKGREKDTNKIRQQPNGQPPEPHRKRCRICNQLGHNRATCRQRNNHNSQVNDDSSNQPTNYRDTTCSQLSTSNVQLDDDTTVASNLQNYNTSVSSQEYYGSSFCIRGSSQVRQQENQNLFHMGDSSHLHNTPFSFHTADAFQCDNSED